MQELPSVSVGLKAVTKCQSQIRGLRGNWGSVPAPPAQRLAAPGKRGGGAPRGLLLGGCPWRKQAHRPLPPGLHTELRLREHVAGAPVLEFGTW